MYYTAYFDELITCPTFKFLVQSVDVTFSGKNLFTRFTPVYIPLPPDVHAIPSCTALSIVLLCPPMLEHVCSLIVEHITVDKFKKKPEEIHWTT